MTTSRCRISLAVSPRKGAAVTLPRDAPSPTIDDVREEKKPEEEDAPVEFALISLYLRLK